MIMKIKAIKNITIFLSCLVVSVACTIPCWALQADINYDSEVNFLDLAILANEWLKTGQQEIPPTKGTASFVVAANDAPDDVKIVADYLCDGTNDEVQIQAAIDALPAYAAGGGGTIILSSGNFYIGASVDIRGNCRIVGQGVDSTRVYLAANVDMFVMDRTLASPELFFYLEYLYLDGANYNNYSGRGLVANNKLWDVYISNCFFAYFDKDAIYTEEAWGWVISKTIIEFGTGNGFVLGDGTGPKLFDCKIMENEKNAIHLQDGGCTHIVNCELAGTDIGVNDTTFYILLDCGNDVSAWDVGDSVRNDIGDGDDWTGTVYEVSYLGNNEHIIVAMAAGKDDTDIDLADGIENTTKSDTTTLDSKTIHRYCGVRIESSVTENCLVGNKINMSTTAGNYCMGVYLKAGRNVITGNSIMGGHSAIEIVLSSGAFNTIVGNKFYNQSTETINDGDGRTVIEGNEGYVNKCMEEISVVGDGVATTITLNHNLASNAPTACERIFTITPLSQKMAESTYWISSISSSQVVITFSAALENGQTYKFHIVGRFQRRDWNLTVS